MDAEKTAEDNGWEFAGQLHERGVASGTSPDPDAVQPSGKGDAVHRASGEGSGEQPGRAVRVAHHGVPLARANEFQNEAGQGFRYFEWLPPEPGSVGWTVDTNQYFIDLQTVAGLITLTWPAARNVALSAEHVEILEQDALEREDRRDRLKGGSGKFHHFHTLASPSVDAKAYVAATAIAHQILKGTDSGALTALAPVHAHLQEVQGPMKTTGDRMRNFPRNSPPLRFLLTHRTPITIEGIHQYATARDRKWRPAP
ncbi:hypothetical protein ACIQVA_39805 [Streptomyces microflavus]|uniref:hypothetical protein n=1 Tax=Streptomyces microflavus TaxID=1919 RepID=UPI00381FA920